MQQSDGIVEGWHGDGNFARTALMFGLWKTQGARLSPWNSSIRLGAESSPNGTYFVITAEKDFEGKLIFDPIRHKTILNLPVDYPRINQFPEWFTIDPGTNYRITASNQRISATYSGKKLIEGLWLKVTSGERLVIVID